MSILMKSMAKFSSTATAGETITCTNLSPDQKNGAWKMDVLVNVKTLSGTSPTVIVEVQENFSDAGFIGTAKTGTLSGTGKSFLVHEVCESSKYTNNIGSFAVAGKGGEKQIVLTTGGTVGAIEVDVYLIFYN